MKVVINGRPYEYDGQRAPMSEALAIEHVYKRRYAEWQTDLQAGSAKAMCVLAWIILRRDGTDVPFEDIVEGRFDFDLLEMLTSMAEAAQDEAEAEAGQDSANPTPAGSGPAGTPGTGTGTSPSSPASSISARGKSGSSKSGTSRR